MIWQQNTPEYQRLTTVHQHFISFVCWLEALEFLLLFSLWMVSLPSELPWKPQCTYTASFLFIHLFMDNAHMPTLCTPHAHMQSSLQPLSRDQNTHPSDMRPFQRPGNQGRKVRKRVQGHKVGSGRVRARDSQQSHSRGRSELQCTKVLEWGAIERVLQNSAQN